jgi:acyl-coenzyme A thioesterase PaaI-like protein
MGEDGPGLAGGHIYARLGIESRLVDATTVETVLPVGEVVVITGGVRAAHLGLAMEHGAPLLARVAAVPVVISVHLRGLEAGAGEVRVRNRLVKAGRTLMVTEAVFLDRSGGRVGFGTVTWSVSSQQQEVPPATTSVPPWPDNGSRRGILDVLDVIPLSAADGCQLQSVTPDIAGPGGVLHAGAIQFLCEEAALIAGRARMSTDHVSTRDSVLHLVATGRVGPFTATSSLLMIGHDGADCRAELRDEGQADRLLAVADLRLV